LIPLSPGNKFIVGINKGWFGGEYDHDLGYNQFSKNRAYNPNITNLSLPDPNPDKPYLSSHVEEIHSFFRKLQTAEQNVDVPRVVRVWAFELFEGLRFDAQCHVIGIDSEFLSNLNILMSAAKSVGVEIYLCLFDAVTICEKPPSDLAEKELQRYFELQNTWKKIMRLLLKDKTAQQKFFDNALHQLLEQSSIVGNLFAIDLMNEPEGLIEKDPEFNLQDIINFIASSSDYIRKVDSSIRISCGFQRHSTLMGEYYNTKAYVANNLKAYLDFFDFHEYNASGILEYNDITAMTGKPCIVGECGYPLKGSNPKDPNDPINATEVAVIAIQRFFENANSKSFAGCISWFEDYKKKQDGILESLKDFTKKNPMILEAKKQGCFIATAAMGSELHPHVQLLRQYRDSVILKSVYKEPFLKILDVYYSFSPAVADLMEKNAFAKSLIKYLFVYPLVLSIKILTKLIGK